MIRYDMIYLLTAIGLTPGGSSTVHIYTQTINRTTQNKQYIEQHNNLGECRPCPVLASYTLAFALQLREKHEKTSVRARKPQSCAGQRPAHETVTDTEWHTRCCIDKIDSPDDEHEVDRNM